MKKKSTSIITKCKPKLQRNARLYPSQCKTKNKKGWLNCGETETLCWEVGRKNGAATVENSMVVSENIKSLKTYITICTIQCLSF